jgi:hypothetical protein
MIASRASGMPMQVDMGMSMGMDGSEEDEMDRWQRNSEQPSKYRYK